MHTRTPAHTFTNTRARACTHMHKRLNTSRCTYGKDTKKNIMSCERHASLIQALISRASTPITATYLVAGPEAQSPSSGPGLHASQPAPCPRSTLGCISTCAAPWAAFAPAQHLGLHPRLRSTSGCIHACAAPQAASAPAQHLRLHPRLRSTSGCISTCAAP